MKREIQEQARQYAAGHDRPLGGYLGAMGAFGVLASGLTALTWLSGRKLPERPAWSDLVLVTVASHKVARLIAKDPVTSPLRAPFTRFLGQSGPAEVEEEVRGSGGRKVVGEMLTCPFCLAQWVATVLMFGLVLAPRPTRLVASVFTALTGADFLQVIYSKLEEVAD